MLLKQTKIVASISDRRCDVDFIKELFDAGMNVVRMNTAHASREGFEALIANVRAVSNHRYMAELLTGMNIGYMNFNYRRGYGADSVLQSNGSVCISSCVQYDPIHIESGLLNNIYDFPFNIRLEIAQFHIGIFFTKFSQILFKCNASIYRRFTLAQKINIGTINNLYPHNTILLFLIPLSSRTIFQGAKVEKRNEIRGKNKKEG